MIRHQSGDPRPEGGKEPESLEGEEEAEGGAEVGEGDGGTRRGVGLEEVAVGAVAVAVGVGVPAEEGAVEERGGGVGSAGSVGLGYMCGIVLIVEGSLGIWEREEASGAMGREERFGEREGEGEDFGRYVLTCIDFVFGSHLHLPLFLSFGRLETWFLKRFWILNRPGGNVFSSNGWCIGSAMIYGGFLMSNYILAYLGILAHFAKRKKELLIRK